MTVNAEATTHVPAPDAVSEPCPVCETHAELAFTREPGEYRVVTCPTCGLGRTGSS